jgi:hypothetical protein
MSWANCVRTDDKSAIPNPTFQQSFILNTEVMALATFLSALCSIDMYEMMQYFNSSSPIG